jgi:hypothetical protein
MLSGQKYGEIYVIFISATVAGICRFNEPARRSFRRRGRCQALARPVQIASTNRKPSAIAVKVGLAEPVVG